MIQEKMKEFNNISELFIPQTKRAKDLLKKIEEFNKLHEYLKSDEVQKTLNEELGTKPNERYVTINDMGRPDENLCPQNTYILFDTYSNPGQASIIKEFIRVKTDGKLGKIVDHRIDWLSKYPSKFKIKQVSDNYKPNKKSETLSLNEAVARFPENENVIIGNKIHELFSKYGIEMSLDFNRIISSEKIYINSEFRFDYKSFLILKYEASKFFTPSMLSRDARREEIVDKLVKDGYYDKTINKMIIKDFNDWSKNTLKSKLQLEITFSCNSIMMFNIMNISLIKGNFCEKFVVKTINHPSNSDHDKLEEIVRKEVDKKIP